MNLKIKRRYLFLFAYINLYEEACGGQTNVNEQKDLRIQFDKSNPYIVAYEIFAPNERVAEAFGLAKVFVSGFSIEDTLSSCDEISLKEKLTGKVDATIHWDK